MPNFKQNQQFDIKEILPLLEHVSPNRKKEIVLHWFTKGYARRLGTVKFSDKWPFPESQEEFMTKNDAVFFIEHVQGGTLIGWTSDKSFYTNYDDSLQSMCKMCGDCCRGIVLRVGSEPIGSVAQFKKACKKHPEYLRFSYAFLDDGSMVFQCTKQEGNLCTDHGNRPLLCMMFPFNMDISKIKPKCGYYKYAREVLKK